MRNRVRVFIAAFAIVALLAGLAVLLIVRSLVFKPRPAAQPASFRETAPKTKY